MNSVKKIKSEFILRWAKKIKAIEHLGGKCNHCDCKDPRILQFHHPDDNKETTISYLLSKSWKRTLKEIDKCILLCNICHAIEHYPEEAKNNKPRENKNMLLDYVGKKECEECGWKGKQCALEFHHKDPYQKEFQISNIVIKLKTIEDLEKNVIDEINKCQLLCANCHRIKHIDERYYLFKNEIFKKSKIIKIYNSLDHEKIRNLYFEEKLNMPQIAKLFNTEKSAIHYIIHKK